MTHIYNQHRAAFAHVAAYVILHNGERVATIAFKYPRDGAGRLYAYVHWTGLPMVRGYANGFGYDKPSAACASASAKMSSTKTKPFYHVEGTTAEFGAFCAALGKNDGYYWHDNLRSAGFIVLQAV